MVEIYHIPSSLIIITVQNFKGWCCFHHCVKLTIIKATILGPLSGANLHSEKLIFISGVKKDT